MKIMSIDPGYERLGIAVLDENTLLHSECFQTDAKLSFDERLFLVGEKIAQIIKSFQPKALAIEKIYFNKNHKTALNVAEVCGMIKYIAKAHKLLIFEYTPLQIKSAVTGNGHCSKHEIISMLPKLTNINKKIKYDDEYDAIAAGITCFASEKF